MEHARTDRSRPVPPEIVPVHDGYGGNLLSPMNEFRHVASGDLYKLIAVGYREADLTPIVIYRRLDGSGPIWDRPISEWVDGRYQIARSGLPITARRTA